MISERWAEAINSLADRGIPLYFITDRMDDAGIPSWAVLGAIGLVLFAVLAFLLFPMAKTTLGVDTTPGSKVIVSYGEEKVTSTTETGQIEFSVPLGSAVNVKITKGGCEAESIEIVMLDQYTLNKPLVCS